MQMYISKHRSARRLQHSNEGDQKSCQESEDWQRGAGQNKGLLRALLQSELALLLTTLLDSGLYRLFLLWGSLQLNPHKLQCQQKKEDFSEFYKPTKQKLGGKG